MLLYVYETDEKNKLTKTISLYQAEPKFYITMPEKEDQTETELAPVFDYKNFPFIIFKDCPVHSKRGKTLDRVSYLDLVTSFDIETTTILNTDTPYAFMYQWQFCIEDYVFMGRTWEEYLEFMEILHKEFDLHIQKGDDNAIFGRSLVIYVQNLNFEFQFCRHFIGGLINPMITDKYCPLLIPTEQGFTYRCSYRLTNKSLNAFTKGMPHEKLKGELDYNVIRTPKTVLTDKELAYCYNDVKGLCEALRDMFTRDKKYNIASVPVTSTGFVRKDARTEMRKNPQNHKRFIDSKLDEHLYKLMRLAFRGGNTHANASHVGEHLHNVKSWDITSSYPAWILTKTYPIGNFEKITNTDNLIKNFNMLVKNYCLLVTIRRFDFEYIGSCGVPYISRDKTFIRVMDEKLITEDNGRIAKCPTFADMTLTDIDLMLILKDYKYKRIEIIEAYKATRGKLPKELRDVCFEYYKQKTQLKDLPDTEENPDNTYNYSRYKGLLNSTYGMMVQRIDRREYQYIDGEYIEVKKPLQQQLDKFYSTRSSFLSYQHGVWVTAWARFVLHMGCEIAGADLVYIDTDSVKYIGDHEKGFEELNKELIRNAQNNGAVAYNKDGKPFYIGVYDQEKTYTDFKCLRSKCYIFSYDNGKTIKATISGVAKDVGQKYFTKHGFDALKDGLKIKISGKLTPHYNNDFPHYIEYNGERILTASNIALVPADYTIKIQKAHIAYIESIKKKLKGVKNGRSDNHNNN